MGPALREWLTDWNNVLCRRMTNVELAMGLVAWALMLASAALLLATRGPRAPLMVAGVAIVLGLVAPPLVAGATWHCTWEPFPRDLLSEHLKLALILFVLPAMGAAGVAVLSQLRARPRGR